MPGLGRAMADALIEIGIESPAQLRKAGAKQAYRRLRFAHGRKITLTWVYALDVAIRGVSWRDLTPERADYLRRAAELIVAEVGNSPNGKGKG